jgi:hypothetical protein
VRDDTHVRSLLVAVTVALLLPAAALAHVELSPGLLESGREVELRVELPELRPDVTPTGLEVLGEGLRQLTSSPAGRVGEETRWRVRIRVDAPPGPVDVVLRALFADGRHVDVRRVVTVVPAGAGGDSPPVAAIAAATVALAALVGAAVLLRRRAAGS